MIYYILVIAVVNVVIVVHFTNKINAIMELINLLSVITGAQQTINKQVRESLDAHTDTIKNIAKELYGNNRTEEG